MRLQPSLFTFGGNTASTPLQTSPNSRRVDPRRTYRSNLPPIRESSDEDLVQLEFTMNSLSIKGGSIQSGRNYLPQLMKTLAHARTAQRLFPNFSHRHYGAAVELENGVMAIGANIEASRQTSLCDLRVAMTQAFNQNVAQFTDQPVSLVPQPPRVKTIFLVNAAPDGEKPVPCADCQDWMNSRFCSPETKVVSLEQDPDKRTNLLRIRTVKDMLPLHIGRSEPVRMSTYEPVDQLPLQISHRAQPVLRRIERNPGASKLTHAVMRKMIKEAQTAYQQNQHGAKESGMKTGVCARMEPDGSLHSQERFEWSTRWFEAPDLRAVADGFQSRWALKKSLPDLLEGAWFFRAMRQNLNTWLKPPSVQALAYVGDDPNLPPLTSLGRIARRRGSSNTLILTVENDVIHCRTLAEFMPEMYQTTTRQTQGASN